MYATVLDNDQKINSIYYQEYLGDFMDDVDFDPENSVIQQDAAPPHHSNSTLTWLKDRCGEMIFAQGTVKIQTSNVLPPWAPHSPDMNPLDFYLWGRIKQILVDQGWPT